MVENITKLVNTDCYTEMLKLPDKCIDLIYTDPPYNVGIFHEGSGGSVNKVGKLDKTLMAVIELPAVKTAGFLLH